MAKKTKSATITIDLPVALVEQLEPILLARDLTLDEAVRLYLRAMVSSSARNRTLTLESEMPMGKYRGELVEVIVRAEPGYISWLIANSTSIKFDPEVLMLMERLNASTKVEG